MPRTTTILEIIITGLLLLLLLLYLYNKTPVQEEQTICNFQEGQYIEYIGSYYKIISISEDNKYVIIKDVDMPNHNPRLLKIRDSIRNVDTAIVEKYLELKNK